MNLIAADALEKYEYWNNVAEEEFDKMESLPLPDLPDISILYSGLNVGYSLCECDDEGPDKDESLSEDEDNVEIVTPPPYSKKQKQLITKLTKQMIQEKEAEEHKILDNLLKLKSLNAGQELIHLSPAGFPGSLKGNPISTRTTKKPKSILRPSPVPRAISR